MAWKGWRKGEYNLRVRQSLTRSDIWVDVRELNWATSVSEEHVGEPARKPVWLGRNSKFREAAKGQTTEDLVSLTDFGFYV